MRRGDCLLCSRLPRFLHLAEQYNASLRLKMGAPHSRQFLGTALIGLSQCGHSFIFMERLLHEYW